MNIKSAPVLFWGFPAMPTNLVALSDFLCNLCPSGVINRVSILAKVLSHIAANVLASIPSLFTSRRTESAIMSLANFTAFFTDRKTLLLTGSRTGAGTEFRDVPKLPVKNLATLFAYSLSVLFFCLPVTRIRTILNLFVPVKLRDVHLFSKGCST